MSNIDRLAEKAKRYGQPALAITDHGNMSGTVQLYKAGKKHGIQVFPGLEGYLVLDDIADNKSKRYHVGLIALNRNGYKSLVALTSKTHTRPNFNRFPRMTIDDLTELSARAKDDVAVTTGCFFGLVQQMMVADGDLNIKAATRMIKMYASLFTNTYVEIQNHNIAHPTGVTDRDIGAVLYATAKAIGLPVIATQDSHYAEQGQKIAHALMKRMVYGGTEDEFPGDSYHFASTEWMQEHYDEQIWDEVEDGMEHLLSLNKIEFPALDNFKFHCPNNVPNPQRVAARYCMNKLKKLRKATNAKYTERLIYELDIIEHLAIASYLTMWMGIVEWCHEHGYAIEARGSANSSLVCYLLGITQVDPIKWGLMFERFLSKDRKKPPDIDMDVEDGARAHLLRYIAKTYPSMQIGTFSELGSGIEGDRGSVMVSYVSGLRKTMEKDAFYSKYGGKLNSISDVKKYSMKDYKALRQLATMKVHRSYGVHAAGVLIGADTQPIDEYVPHMLVASSNTAVTQFEMKDVEQLGYMKVDILGQRTLTAMKRCQELMNHEDPTDFTWIPEDDPESLKILRSGLTDTAVFQFDGYAMAKGGRALGVRSTKDCVIAGALFRPALMQNGLDELYIQRRNDREARNAVRYPHPIFEKHLKETYGIVLYQEQVINIMRDLGLTYEGINTFFDAVKDSGVGSGQRNMARFASVREEFEQICNNNGIADHEAAWYYIEGYVAYGFNKGHSTGYGVRSYRTAYLKTHYPLEYMSAVLESCATSNAKEKEKLYMREARRMGIRILPPDVNISNALWTMDAKRGAIRRGLTTIHGVGFAAASQLEEVREDGGPFEDIQNIIDRTTGRGVSGGKTYAKDGTLNGVLYALQQAGALDSIGQ
jgi:DNA polymerase-3 subunit alpha